MFDSKMYIYMTIFFLRFQLAISGILEIGQPCCLEDWQSITGKHIDAFKTHYKNLDSKEFKEAYKEWVMKLPSYTADSFHPEGICSGLLGYKCVNKQCMCNTDIPPFKVSREGEKCVADDGQMCVTTKDQIDGVECKVGWKCDKKPGQPNSLFQYCALKPTENANDTNPGASSSTAGAGGGKSGVSVIELGLGNMKYNMYLLLSWLGISFISILPIY